MAIVIAFSTYILERAADGFGYNTKTGQIIENGLLFVDSKPGGADIYLNGQKQSNTTAARLVLPAGEYTLTLKKSGYRDWQRKFVLYGHSVARFVYPFLFPEKPRITPLKTYDVMSPLVSESPDHHWLLVQTAAADGSLAFDEYDTSALAQAPLALDMPASLLTASTDPSSIKEVEWSTDNKHLLLEHDFGANKEFIIFDRTDPTQSINVNNLFKISPTEVSLRDKKVDQLYIYSHDKGSLQVADVGQDQLDPPFLKNVLAFKPYGSSIISYVTDVGAPTGDVVAKIWDNGNTYPFYTFTAGSTYLLDIAQFQSHIYYVAGSNAEERVNIYRDPEAYIKDPNYGKAVPLIALDNLGATKVGFSDNARFIGAEAGQTFAVYDLEQLEYYHYVVKQQLAASLTWMDGHRFIGVSGGNVFVCDYDGTNQILVTPTVLDRGAYFSNDYNQMIVFAPVAGSTSVTLERVDMRAGVDLPKNGAQ